MNKQEIETKWTVGLVNGSRRLGVFDTESEGANFIATLPDYEKGIYYLDEPAITVSE